MKEKESDRNEEDKTSEKEEMDRYTKQKERAKEVLKPVLKDNHRFRADIESEMTQMIESLERPKRLKEDAEKYNKFLDGVEAVTKRKMHEVSISVMGFGDEQRQELITKLEACKEAVYEASKELYEEKQKGE